MTYTYRRQTFRDGALVYDDRLTIKARDQFTLLILINMWNRTAALQFRSGQFFYHYFLEPAL